MLITHNQMWTRYKSIKKKELYDFKICCPVCNQEIVENEDGVEYSKTKRGSDVFIHRDCIYREAGKIRAKEI